MSLSEFLNKPQLDESVLSRLNTYLQSPDFCFCILTASRHENTNKENEAKNKELRQLTRKAVFGYRRVLGHYLEEETKNGQKLLVPAADDSIIVSTSHYHENELLEFGKQMMKRYSQKSILFKSCDGTVKLYFNDGSTQQLGDFHPNKTSDYMSTFKNGKSFVFDVLKESVYSRFDNHIDCMGKHCLRAHALKDKLFETCVTPDDLGYTVRVNREDDE